MSMENGFDFDPDRPVESFTPQVLKDKLTDIDELLAGAKYFAEDSEIAYSVPAELEAVYTYDALGVAIETNNPDRKQFIGIVRREALDHSDYMIKEETSQIFRIGGRTRTVTQDAYYMLTVMDDIGFPVLQEDTSRHLISYSPNQPSCPPVGETMGGDTLHDLQKESLLRSAEQLATITDDRLKEIEDLTQRVYKTLHGRRAN